MCTVMVVLGSEAPEPPMNIISSSLVGLRLNTKYSQLPMLMKGMREREKDFTSESMWRSSFPLLNLSSTCTLLAIRMSVLEKEKRY